MTAKFKVLIVEDNRHFAEAVSNYFTLKNVFEISDIAPNARDAIQKLDEVSPDLVLLDLVMPKSDGFVFLEHLYARTDENKPQVIVLTSLSQESVIQRACNLGAVYYMVKPVSLNDLHTRCMDVIGMRPAASRAAVQLSSEEQKRRIYDITLESGIPAGSKGHMYLVKALEMIVEQPDLIFHLTTDVYPRIGKEYGTLGNTVEKAIRYAIETAWKSGRLQNINTLLNVNVVSQNYRPSNGELMSLIAKRLQSDNSMHPR